jgi:hypothetical protein
MPGTAKSYNNIDTTEITLYYKSAEPNLNNQESILVTDVKLRQEVATDG